ncbi:transmembrane protein 45B-like [Argopecten irradians]|uniref:transmembrane protein 45B-like n=1 Tax=Argopecten irradians TaxID=31199 RepID=UPI0037211EE8
MGFTGHMIIGSFMFSISVWWMFNIFRDYVLSKRKNSSSDFTSRISYLCSTCRKVPIEAIWKVVAFTFVLLCEVGSSRLVFIDPKDGGFRAGAITNLQHMTMYGMFLVHACVDLMAWKLPVPDGASTVTLALALVWSGVSIHSGHNKNEFLILIHILPTYVMFVVAALLIIEFYNNYSCFLASAFRVFGTMLLGTWFCQMAFVSFDRHELIGNAPNPHWDQSDPRNIQMLVALFGGHIILDLIVSMLFYTAMYLRYGRGGYEYKTKELGEEHEKLMGIKSPEFQEQKLIC